MFWLCYWKSNLNWLGEWRHLSVYVTGDSDREWSQGLLVHQLSHVGWWAHECSSHEFSSPLFCGPQCQLYPEAGSPCGDSKAACSIQDHILFYSCLAERKKVFPHLCFKIEVELSHELSINLGCRCRTLVVYNLKGDANWQMTPWEWMRCLAACWQTPYLWRWQKDTPNGPNN